MHTARHQPGSGHGAVSAVRQGGRADDPGEKTRRQREVLPRWRTAKRQGVRAVAECGDQQENQRIQQE